jgi:hypothetical protein
MEINPSVLTVCDEEILGSAAAKRSVKITFRALGFPPANILFNSYPRPYILIPSGKTSIVTTAILSCDKEL